MLLLAAGMLNACGGTNAAPADASSRGSGGAGGVTPMIAPPSGGTDGSVDTAAGGASGTAAGGADGTASDAAAPPPGASYVVPAGPDTPEGRYRIDSLSTEISGNDFRLDYKLPALLVGEEQSISLRGTLDAARRIATVSGDAGTATCDLMPGGDLILRCDENLTGINVDLDSVSETARATDPTHAPSLIAIAKRFASEPIGILEVR